MNLIVYYCSVSSRCGSTMNLADLWTSTQMSHPAWKLKTADLQALCALGAVNLVIFSALNLKITPTTFQTFYPVAAAMFSWDNTATKSIQMSSVISLSALIVELCLENWNLSVKNAISEGKNVS